MISHRGWVVQCTTNTRVVRMVETCARCSYLPRQHDGRQDNLKQGNLESEISGPKLKPET